MFKNSSNQDGCLKTGDARQLTVDDNIQRLFRLMDGEINGRVPSFEAYLLDVPMEVRNAVHFAMRIKDKKNYFHMYDFEEFRSILLASQEFVSVCACLDFN